MNRSQRQLTLWMLAFCLLLVAAASPALAQQAGSGSSSAPAKPPAQASPSATKPGAPSVAEISAAKSSGKVWVNTETRVYHKAGRWYGKTKTGKFMTEADAKAAGYKESKR